MFRKWKFCPSWAKKMDRISPFEPEDHFREKLRKHAKVVLLSVCRDWETADRIQFFASGEKPGKEIKPEKV